MAGEERSGAGPMQARTSDGFSAAGSPTRPSSCRSTPTREFVTSATGPASWAPTRLAWSYDNRTASFRVVGKGQSLRIECRIPGADCNPYLAFAAALASGLNGIEKKLEPPPVFEGDMYAARRCRRSRPRFATPRRCSSRVRSVRESLGGDVTDHYAHFFEVEQGRLRRRRQPDWERKRYFEQI